MANENTQIDGQLTFDFCLDATNYVCQANAILGGKQALKLNSAKLVRAAIMQIVREDTELKPYIITIPELSKLLNIPKNNLYRDAEDVVDDLIRNPLYIRQEQGKELRWVKIPWVSRCEYNSKFGLYIKLNDELKPFLLNLKQNYTQYQLEEILCMKSTYTIRLYELLQERILTKTLPKEGKNIVLSLQEIRECCGCESKAYTKFPNLKARVIEPAINEINNKTVYKISYTYVKKGRAVIGINFHINTWYH